jgi:hypothetical protein
MTSKKQGHEKAMNAKGLIIITAIVLIALVALVSSAPLALAADAELTIEPSVNITPGTPIHINGTGFNSSEPVTITASVTCYKPVSDGRCECTMQDFDLPANVSLKLSVRRVTDNVSIYIKKGFWWKISPGLTSFFTFDYNPTTSTSNVSSGKILPSLAGTYSIDVIGDAVPGEKNCTMVTSAKLEVEADADGNFSLIFDTHGIPLCEFTLNATGDASGKSDEAPMNLFQLGDPSMDGQINAYDCVCIARYWALVDGYDNNTIAPSAAAGIAYPCNTVTMEDARYLAQYLIQLQSSIPHSDCIP